MATADEVIVEFRAEIGRYQADLRRAKLEFERTTNAQADAIANLESQISASSGAIADQVKDLAGTVAAAFSVYQLQQYADSYTRVINQIKVAGRAGDELGSTYEDLFQVAQRYGVELESIATLYSRSSQVAGELGASQDQLVQISSAVAAALKIQGTSAAEAQGALLQLSQALGSGTVRAEEFNSINEGALPILKAVAQNMDGVGGSIAKLKSLVNDGEVSSQEFFQALLKGSKDLEAQAAQTSLTIENSFTVLNNAIGKYVGETDSALSATERISQAIILLAENVETVATALAVIATVLGARYVATIGTAAAATIAKAVSDERAALAATAHAAAQARLNPLMLGAGASATTAAAGVSRLAVAQGLAARAGTGLAAIFGGPVGLAVIALTVGIGYLVTRTDDAAEASGEYAKQQKVLSEIQGKAADAADAVATATGKAREEALRNAKALRAETQEYIRNAEAALIAARAKASEAAQNARTVQQSYGAQVSVGTAGAIGGNFAGGRTDRDARQAATNLRAAEQNLEKAEEEYDRLQGIIKGLSGPPTALGGGKPEKEKKGKKPPEPKTGPSAEDLETAYASDLARLQAEELQARIQLATNVDERADLQRELLALEKRERLREIDLQAQRDLTDVQADETTTPEQKQALARIIDQQRQAQIAIVDALYGKAREIRNADGSITVNPAIGKYTEQVLQDLNDEILRQKRDELALQLDVLDSQANIERSIEARNQIEQRAIAIQQEIERSLLEQQIANGEIADADKARALLAQRQANNREALNRSQQSPFEQYISDLQDVQANMSLELESLGVDVLSTFNDKLVDAIVNFRSLGDVGRAALASLTEGLVRLALQQVILRTIGSTLGTAATAATTAQAGAAAAAWAPAAALASLATLGTNAGPAAAALASTAALSAGIAATSGAAGFADGGRIRGPGTSTSDSIPINASNDEFMLRAKAARSIGYDNLEYMNRTGELPDVSTSAPRAAGSPGGSSRDMRADIREAVAQAAKVMPPVNLYPTLDPAAAFDAALADPRAQRKLLDFFGQNSGKINSRLSR